MAILTEKPKPWKTVRYGAERSSGLLIPYSLPFQLEKKDCRLSELAEDILAKMETSHQISEVDLAIATPRELGITTKEATTADIYEHARALGLGLCKAEIAVYLRLQYDSQPEDEVLHIAMEPLKNSVGYPRNFYLTKKNGVLWLRTRSGHQNRRWEPDSRWVFVTSSPRAQK